MTRDVETFRVMFPSAGTILVGRLHRRAGTSIFERQPAVVVSGSWLTVKEQMPDLYAAGLARRGFTALTFDFAGWGESHGEPRHLESPSRKIADITAAAEYLTTLSLVEPGSIGYLGVCATSQYGLTAVAQGAPIQSYACVAGWFDDLATAAPFYGGADGVAARLRRAEAALERYLQDGEVVTVPAYDPGNEVAAMFLEMDYYSNPARGAVPSWPNEMAEMSWLPWLTFDGMSQASSATAPALFVHSEQCVFPDHIRRLERELPGPVEVVWGEGSQTDFYDKPAQVGVALDAAARHFASTLGAPTATA